MELRILKYFVAVVEQGSLTAASEELRIAQPSLSRQLRAFETRIGVSLFDRSGKRLKITPAGAAFLPVARDLLRRSESAAAAISQLATGRATRLTVVAAPATVTDLITPFIVRGGTSGLIVDVVTESPDNVYDVLRSGGADFAVGTRLPPSDLASKVVGHAYLWAEFPPGYRDFSMRYVALAELVRWPLIVMTRDQGVRRMLDDAVAQAGLSYLPAYEVRSTEVAQALAAAGRGVCVLSDDSRFSLLTIPIRAGTGEIKFSLYGTWDPKHFAADSIMDTLDEFTDFATELYGP